MLRGESIAIFKGTSAGTVMNVPSAMHSAIRDTKTYKRWRAGHHLLPVHVDGNHPSIVPIHVLQQCLSEIQAIEGVQDKDYVNKKMRDAFFGRFEKNVTVEPELETAAKESAQKAHTATMDDLRARREEVQYSVLVANSSGVNKPKWFSEKVTRRRWGQPADEEQPTAGMLKIIGFAVNFHVTVLALFFTGTVLGERLGLSSGGALIAGAAAALITFVVEAALFVLLILKAEVTSKAQQAGV